MRANWSEAFWYYIHRLRRDNGIGPCKPASSCPICTRALMALKAGR